MVQVAGRPGRRLTSRRPRAAPHRTPPPSPAGLVDEVIVKLNPVLFGAGIPLLARGVPAVALELEELRRFPSGHAWLQYRVRR